MPELTGALPAAPPAAADDRPPLDQPPLDERPLQRPTASATTSEPVVEPARQSGNFIVRNWRGEYSLGVSYWVFGFLGNILLGLVITVAAHALFANSAYDPWIIFASFASIWSAVTAVGTWQFVGIWRSANRHIGARARLHQGAPWAHLAKVAAFLGVLKLVLEFAGAGLPQITEASRMAFMGDPSIPDYAIRIMRNGSEAEITGGFKYGLTSDFVRILQASPRIKVVHLDSAGGRIGEAEKLNKVIRERTLATYVSSQCLSACTMAFAGGRERWIRRGGVLGFHAPAFPGMTKRDLSDAASLQKRAFVEAGFEPRFVDRALSTANTDLWTPSADELLGAKVITAVSDGSHFAASGYGANVTLADVGEALAKHTPLLATLQTRLPKDYDALIGEFYENYLIGRTELEVRSASQRRILAIIVSNRPLADDAVLVEFARLYAEQYAAIGAQDPTACYNYATGADGAHDYMRIVPKALLDREDALGEHVIATAAARPPVTDQIFAPVRDKLVRQLQQRFGSAKARLLIANAKLPPSKHADYCAMSVALFQEIVSLPQNEAAMFIRHLFSRK